jgi:hypothetical protein
MLVQVPDLIDLEHAVIAVAVAVAVAVVVVVVVVVEKKKVVVMNERVQVSIVQHWRLGLVVF